MIRTLSLMFLVACGGSFNSGLDDDATLGSLAVEDACMLVEDEAEWSADQLSETEACYVGAQLAAAFAVGLDPDADYATACQEAFDSCGDATDDPVDPVEPMECTASPFGEDCAATVAQYEECAGVEADALKELAARECTPPADGEDGELTPNAACTAVAACTPSMTM